MSVEDYRGSVIFLDRHNLGVWLIRFLLATAIDDSAEALYRIVADIPDPVAKARAALSAVDQIQGHLLPDLVSIRRAAIREARQRMSAQELADRLGMSRSRVYAVLASADNGTGPLTIHYRTAAGGSEKLRWLGPSSPCAAPEESG